MNYSQTIDYLVKRLPMFSRVGAAAYKNDLTNTIALCNFLGNPQSKFKSVHIAGTNGKGSTSHMLAAIFQTAGYKTGLYTSPHMKDFRERIKVNGEMPDQDFITRFVGLIQPVIEKIEPSFFEITVAMAFAYFAEQEVDVAIVEVGLGGRFDSTNIIGPELSVITNIGFDHVNLLGDTLEKIAFEKAGIIKPGVPAVVGEFNAETSVIFKQVAASRHASLSFADTIRFVADWKMEKHELAAEVTTTHNNEKEVFHLDLTGIYQIKNLLTVLETVHRLRQKGWNLNDANLHKALRQVKRLTGLHGRWETIGENPTVVTDVAHNEDGIRQLARQIEITDHEELHIVIGFVKDKDISRILTLLPEQARYYFTRAQIPRALPENELLEKAEEAGLRGEAFDEVNKALGAALSRAGKKDLVVVCGSVFVVGEVTIHSTGSRNHIAN